MNKNEINMSVFHTELAGKPNSCLVKINNRKYWAVLDSGAEVSFIHTRLYNMLKVKPKLNKQSTLLQSVKGDSLDVDGCIWLNYEIGIERQEHEFFVHSAI